MLLIKKWYDSDIASIPLFQTTQNQSKINASYSASERSTAGEESAIFQPNGKLISFISERSGEDQLWITHGNDAQLMSEFPTNTLIRGIDWAADGKSTLVNANGRLSQVFLDRSRKDFTLARPVLRLFQWDSKHNTALLSIYTEGISKFVELNLTNSEFRVLTDKKVNWAQKGENGLLIYTDHLNRFWRPGPVEDQLIESLNEQGSDKRFVIKDNVIYGINKENQLWLYDLNNKAFKVLRKLHESVDFLTDINKTHALIELRIEAKKEVIELTVSE